MPVQTLHASWDAPFVAFEDEALFLELQGGQSGDVTDSLEYFGRGDSGELVYRNTAKSFLGLLFGTCARDRHKVIKRIIESHMEDGNAQVLMLYCADNELSHAADYFIPSISDVNSPKVLISPNKPLRISRMYADDKYSVEPIYFSEEDINLCDILDLFTQTFNGPGSAKLHNKVNLIVSQLSEPLDLQRLSQLIDEESWDDEQSTFIALRQTLLTKMVALAEDRFRLPLTSHRQILVDIRDAILGKTGIDLVLMNMVLREFLEAQSGRKLIVVLHGEQVLNTVSSFSKSLELVAHSGLASVLITAIDPSILSSPTYKESDFIFHTRPNSISWKKMLKKHFSEMNEPALVHHSDALGILSPSSVHFRRQSNTGCAIRHWEYECRNTHLGKSPMISQFINNPVYDTTGSLVNAKGQPETVDDGDNESPLPLPSPPLSKSEGITRQESSMLNQGDVDDDDELKKEFMVHLYRTEGMYDMRAMDHPYAELEDKSIQNAYLQSPSPMKEETDFEAVITYFPSRHRLLVSAIIALAEPYITTSVKYKDVKRHIGKRGIIKKLGWTNFAEWVQLACTDNCIEMLVVVPDGSQLRLLFPGTMEIYPNQDSLKSSATAYIIDQVGEESLDEVSHGLKNISFGSSTEMGLDTADRASIVYDSNSQSDPYTNTVAPGVNITGRYDPQSSVPEVNPELYPLKFRQLVHAILQLSDNRANIRVGFEDVRNIIGKKGDVRALKLGWVTFTQMVNQAERECCIEQGKNEGNKWIMLLMPLVPAPTTPDDTELVVEDRGPGNDNFDSTQMEPFREESIDQDVLNTLAEISDEGQRKSEDATISFCLPPLSPNKTPPSTEEVNSQTQEGKNSHHNASSTTMSGHTVKIGEQMGLTGDLYLGREPLISSNAWLQTYSTAEVHQANSSSASSSIGILHAHSRSITLLSEHVSEYFASDRILEEPGHTSAALEIPPKKEVPSTTMTNDAKVISTSDTSNIQEGDASNDKARPIEVDVKSYPSRFHSLVQAILQLSENQTNIKVGFEAVRWIVGGSDGVRALNLGWTMFTEMLDEASQEGYIEQIGTEFSAKWIALLPPQIGAIPSPVLSPQTVTTNPITSKTSVDMYTREFRPLIKAILRLSGGLTDVAVDYEATRSQIGTRDDVQALGLGWGTFYEMVKAAVKKSYVIEDGKWLTALKPQVEDCVASSDLPTLAKTQDVGNKLSPSLRNDVDSKSKELYPSSDIPDELDAVDYPSVLYPLAFSVLALTRKRTRAKAQVDDVWQVFQALDGFIDTSYRSLSNLINLAISRNLLTSGTDQCGLWVALEDPRPTRSTGLPIYNQKISESSEESQVDSFTEGQSGFLNYEHFTPLIVTLLTLRNRHSLYTPLIRPVVDCLLKNVPGLLARTQYSTMAEYLDAAVARGLIKMFNEDDREAIALTEQHAGIDVNRIAEWPRPVYFQ